MTATPPLLKTYEDARFLWEAKGWGMDGVGIELAEKPELKRFKISQPTLSRRAKPGSKIPIEPEVAAAVENLETRPGYERRAEIAIRGLQALHGAARGGDVSQLVKEMRECLPGEIALKVIDALEEKADARESKLIDALDEKAGARENKLLQEVGRQGRLSRRLVAICAGVGVMVVAVSMAPLFPRATPPATSQVIVLPPGGPDTSPTWFEPGNLLALSKWGEKRPLDQQVPFRTLPGQKVAPCDEGLGEVAINGNCWFKSGDVKPPCGRLFRHGDFCYRPIAADPNKPVEPGPDR